MKKTLCLILMLALSVICGASVLAVDEPATLALQASQSQLATGETLTVTMNISAEKPVGKVTASVSYDSSILKFVSGSGAKDSGGVIQIEQLNGLDASATITLTFTAVAPGSCNISVTNCAVYDAFEEQYELAGAAAALSVTEPQQSTTQQTTTEPTQTSPVTDANGVPTQGILTDLTVVNGKLVPPFMYSIHEYSVTVPYDVTKVEITGKTASLQDHIWYTGNEDCEVGLNVRTITVTDVNGNKTTYTINVTRLEKDAEVTTAASPVVADSTSSAKDGTKEKINANDNNKDIKQTLMPALYIILAVLIVALVIVIIWIKGKSSGSKEQDKKNTKQRSKIKVSGNKKDNNGKKKK